MQQACLQHYDEVWPHRPDAPLPETAQFPPYEDMDTGTCHMRAWVWYLSSSQVLTQSTHLLYPTRPPNNTQTPSPYVT